MLNGRPNWLAITVAFQHFNGALLETGLDLVETTPLNLQLVRGDCNLDAAVAGWHLRRAQLSPAVDAAQTAGLNHGCRLCKNPACC